MTVGDGSAKERCSQDVFGPYKVNQAQRNASSNHQRRTGGKLGLSPLVGVDNHHGHERKSLFAIFENVIV